MNAYIRYYVQQFPRIRLRLRENTWSCSVEISPTVVLLRNSSIHILESMSLSLISGWSVAFPVKKHRVWQNYKPFPYAQNLRKVKQKPSPMSSSVLDMPYWLQKLDGTY